MWGGTIALVGIAAAGACCHEQPRHARQLQGQISGRDRRAGTSAPQAPAHAPARRAAKRGGGSRSGARAGSRRRSGRSRGAECPFAQGHCSRRAPRQSGRSVARDRRPKGKTRAVTAAHGTVATKGGPRRTAQRRRNRLPNRTPSRQLHRPPHPTARLQRQLLRRHQRPPPHPRKVVSKARWQRPRASHGWR